VLDGGAHERHLANTVRRSVHGDEAAAATTAVTSGQSEGGGDRV